MICRSVQYHWITDPEPDPALSLGGLVAFKMPTKTKFFPSVFLLISVGTFKSIFKNSKTIMALGLNDFDGGKSLLGPSEGVGPENLDNRYINNYFADWLFTC